MKLLFCPHCCDFVTLRDDRDRTCECGKCHGHYITSDPEGTKSVVAGPNVQVIGIGNPSFIPVMRRAVAAVPDDPPDDRKDYQRAENFFDAWVFGPNALAVTKQTSERGPDLWWTVAGQNVTCRNCHMPVYRVQGHHLCPACLDALRDDSLTNGLAA